MAAAHAMHKAHRSFCLIENHCFNANEPLQNIQLLNLATFSRVSTKNKIMSPLIKDKDHLTILVPKSTPEVAIQGQHTWNISAKQQHRPTDLISRKLHSAGT